MDSIALSLVSHTNVGKTTLARTMLRRDVGTVFDQAHVTEVNEAHTLVETDDERLVLWDTPGFGDTARLLSRLRHEGNPLGWFLHAVWDRVRERALWCSQEALRNIRNDADVVLYLVSATEHPDDAGYVALELELLGWLDKPVIVLLNQTGPDDFEQDELLATWGAATKRFEHVRGLLPLDAFARCWVQETTLLERVSEVLPVERRAAMAGVIRAWNARRVATFQAAAEVLSSVLSETSADHVVVPRAMSAGAARRRAMSSLAERLDRRMKDALETLLELHELEGRAAASVREELADFSVANLALVGVKGGAIWGGLLSGAASGLTAEVLTGGLSFGGGLILGALAGAVGGAGLARGYQLATSSGEPAVSWELESLLALASRLTLIYLAVAQFGRGRGEVDDALVVHAETDANPWRAALDASLSTHTKSLSAALKQASAAASEGSPVAPAPQRLGPVFEGLLRDVLLKRYPEAAGLLPRKR
jgi:GTPase Era involved in 16S rRNA processing